jgi:hypothetical protein
MTMAWWQFGALAALILGLAYLAAVLRGRGRVLLFVFVALVAGALTWISVGLMLGGIAPGRTGLMLPVETGLVPAQNEALRQERMLYEMLAQRHPEAIAKISEIEKLRTTGAEAGMRRARLVLLADYLPVYAPRASDSSIRAFAALAIENLQGLVKRDAMLCREIAAGRHAGVTENLNQRAAAALVDVLSSAITQPQNPPDAGEAIALRRQVIDALYQKNGANLMERRLLARSADAPPEPYCRTFIRVFEELLALPPEQSSKVLRFYYGQEGSRG